MLWQASAMVRFAIPRPRLSTRPAACAMAVVAAAALSPLTSAATSQEVAFFPSAWGVFGRQGIVRVINRSDEAGDVSIAAFDDDGNAHGPVYLALRANQAAHFNSRDLEYGNPGKELTGATGPGRGDWRLELESDLDIDVLAYLRTRDGLVTAMHDTARWSDGGLFVPVCRELGGKRCAGFRGGLRRLSTGP